MAALRELRTTRGWTVEELATAAHLDKSTISLIERGKRVPTWRTRRDLAEALGVAAEAIDWPEGKEEN